MTTRLQIGEWQVEPRRNRLIRGEHQVKIDPKVMHVLVFLAERPDEVVHKEQIIETVWEGAFVTDEVLTNAVWELRKALGDDAKDPQYIQTVPRKGYQLIAAVHHLSEGHSSDRAASVDELRKTARRPMVKTSLMIAAALLTLCIIGLGWFYIRPSILMGPALHPVPLTTLDGLERDPALSPDGDQIAFVWNGSEDGHFHVYVKLISDGEPLQLTQAPADDFSPTWSPDGQEIAFLRSTTRGVDGESEVLVIPALGGAERRLAIISVGFQTQLAFTPDLSWSPDGRFLAMPDRRSEEERPGIFLLSMETGEKHRLTSPPPEIVLGDMEPVFSPDGQSLAFVRLAGSENRLYLQPMPHGEPRLLAVHQTPIWDMDWVTDGSALVLVLDEGTSTSLARISVNGGEHVRLPYGEMADSVSIAGNRGRLACTRMSWGLPDLWQLDGPNPIEENAPKKSISSTADEWGPAYSPDGTRIAFVSGRSGVQNIWVCNSEGRNCNQVTHEERALRPQWSPDGRSVTFRREHQGNWDIGIVDVERGFTRHITQDDYPDRDPSWSHDGESIYFASKRSGEWHIWKISAEGGEPVQITTQGSGIFPRESEDGHYIYYSHGSVNNVIRRIPVSGGEATTILEQKILHRGYWTLWNKCIVYLDEQEELGDNMGVQFRKLKLFDLQTQQVIELASFEPGTGFWPGLAVSPDGRSILVSKVQPRTSDIVLVENFH